MKRLILLAFITIITLLPIVADDSLDNRTYSYSNITSGYGAFITKEGVINSVDLGFSFNFASMDDSNKLGIGLGTRCDVLFGVGNKNKSYIGSNVLFGPYFHYNLDSNISLNLTVGPIFNFYFLEDLKNEQITIGPAIDCFATFTPSSFQNISFSVGALAAANFSLQNQATAFSIIPYVSINMNFLKSNFRPYPYEILVIF